jgi:23S rRNA (adenine1618-N6)-methyltransferase
VRRNPLGRPTIDFADPLAVRLLNRALLASAYGIAGWDLPEGYLCPPIPGRADHIHHLADLLAGEAGSVPPRGAGVRVLDIGVGASAIYPLLGHREYGWSFVGTDIDPAALAGAQAVLDANPGLAGAVQLRLQRDPRSIFQGVVLPEETFDLCLCNPPFHGSRAEAEEGSRRKWSNLGRTVPGPAPRDRGRPAAPALNFGGRGGELWCPGGEAAFIGRMVEESAARPGLCRWFSSLVSRSASLPRVQAALRQAGAREVRILEVSQGQKKSRIVAWHFLPGSGPAAG